MKYLVIIFFLIIFSFYSCGPRVEITREYVTNSNWGKANTFEGKAKVHIEKIIFKDTINIFSKDFKKDDIEGEVVDTSFCYEKLYTDNWRINRIYFDREQKDITWVRQCTTDLLQETKVIGKLELNTWYRLYNITYEHVYYVYVDNLGKTHVYRFRTRGLFI